MLLAFIRSLHNGAYLRRIWRAHYKRPHEAVVTTVDCSQPKAHNSAIPQCLREAVPVKTRSVSLNPSDCKFVVLLKQEGFVSECVLSGRPFKSENMPMLCYKALVSPRKKLVIASAGPVIGANIDEPT